MKLNHERRANLYAKARLRPIPTSMEVRRHSKAAGLKDPEDIKTLRRTISGVKRFTNHRILSPAQSEALHNDKPGTNGYVMTSVSKEPVGMGYTVTRHHKSGGSSAGGVFGNRNPVHIANDILKGADRSAMSTWKD